MRCVVVDWPVQCGYESARVVVYLDVQLPVRPFGATTQAYGSVVSMALLLCNTYMYVITYDYSHYTIHK